MRHSSRSFPSSIGDPLFMTRNCGWADLDNPRLHGLHTVRSFAAHVPPYSQGCVYRSIVGQSSSQPPHLSLSADIFQCRSCRRNYIGKTRAGLYIHIRFHRRFILQQRGRYCKGKASTTSTTKSTKACLLQWFTPLFEKRRNREDANQIYQQLSTSRLTLTTD